HMGLLSVLLAWHQMDPVDEKELLRNDAVFKHQRNRNPFIDNPKWVGCLFGTACVDGGTVEPGADAEVWINEFHYDNDGRDKGEFVEIAGPAGTNLSGWTLVGYNGASGGFYRIITLSGEIPDQSNGLGTLAFDFRNLQNGPSDGLALVNGDNEVVEFLSYEGTVTATNGPANGMNSVDIGRAESTSTPAGHSLQREGDGRTAISFSWGEAAPATRGEINTEQSLD
ncbi:MAG: endonuclease, partial [Planctomycetes bacterium]|nr:endonuclease [Planctomycetota bacterium]